MKLAPLTLFFVGLAACDSAEPGITIPLVPDSTVFIVSTLEYSPDTSFYHPQVYVGRITDPLDRRYDLFLDAEHKPNEELWMPIQWAQVGMKLRDLRLRPHPDETAEVAVTGPLGRTEERTVVFQHERRGAYGDLGRDLVVLPRERYRLDIHLADGRRYTAETRLPDAADWVIPDTIRFPLQLRPLPEGGYVEEYGPHLIEWTPAAGAPLTVYGGTSSLEHDRIRVWGLDNDENFPYEDRGDYLRMGGYYFVFTNGYDLQDGPFVGWTEFSRWPLLDWLPLHLRLYQLSPELARYYSPEDYYYTMSSGDPWAVQQWAHNDVVAQRDTTFFRSISNILRLGPHGQPLPHAQSDAVGVFGGYTARYAYSTMKPVRSWDPDSLGWGTEPPLP